VKDFDRAIALSPNYGAAYNNRGNARTLLAAYQPAFQDFRKAVELMPTSAVAFNGRGKAHINAYLKIPNVEIAALCDVDQAVLDNGCKMIEAAGKKRPPTFTDIRKVLDDKSIDAVSIGLSHVKAGRLVALATTGPQRLDILPAVPTVSETLPAIEVLNWYGALLPAKATNDVVSRLYAEIRKALDHPDVRSKLASHGFEVDGRAPEQFRTFRKSEEARWARVIKEAGIQQQ